MNLRELLAIPADRPLDGLIHTRYSTDEQNQSSIDGQINACQRFLTATLPRGHRPEQVNVEIIPATGAEPPRGPFVDFIDEERKPSSSRSSNGRPTTSRPGRSPSG